MKKFLAVTIFCLLFAAPMFSQVETYVTSGFEMIFSFASIDDNGVNESSNLRWAPVLNIQSMINTDLSDKLGLFSGLAIRNVGYIYDNYTYPGNDFTYKKKFRSYNLAVPVGIKLGNLKGGMFLYGGYEIELAFLYKEKTFENDNKINKTTAWFSTRQEIFQHGFLVGIQFPYGANLKFKYYLSEFHNRNYVDSNGVKPYEGLKSQVFYFSLNYNLFRNFDFNTPDSYR